MSLPPVSAYEVDSILAQVGVAQRCGALPPDLGSPGTHVYLLAHVVVKFAVDPGSPRMLRERDALAHLQRVGRLAHRRPGESGKGALPVPRLLGHGALPDGRPWVVMTRLPGAPPLDAVRPAHEVGVPLARKLGGLAARLHVLAPPPGFGTWRRNPGISLVAEQRLRVAAVTRMAIDAGSVSATELSALSALLAETEAALESAPAVPVLAHRDIQPRNVLVGSSGEVTGLVDFEAAGGADPAEDFSRIALDWTSPAFAGFCRGYREAGGRLGGDVAERITYHVLYWALLIFARVCRNFPDYLAPARVAVRRAAAGERPAFLA